MPFSPFEGKYSLSFSVTICFDKPKNGLIESIFCSSHNELNSSTMLVKSSKKLLTRRDKRKAKYPNNTPIFIYKANNHRNFLSHLN